MDDQVEGVDLISSLPQSILHHILSFIDSPQDLFITSVLSKEWKMIWGSFPIFDFDVSEITHVLRRRGDAIPGAVPQDLLAVGGESLTRYSNYRLGLFSVQRDVDAHSFALDMWPRPAHVPFVDGWIQIMVDKNVKEIFLSINPVHLPRRYTLPNTILSSTKLTSLTIECCDLPVNFTSHGVPVLSLTSLTLRQVRISDQALQKLTVVFPSVKELYLFWCPGYTKLILSLLKKLVKAELIWESAEVIQLDAPELQHLSYVGWAENISFNLSCTSKLKTLHLSNTRVLHISDFCQLVSSCTVLEELWLNVECLEEKFILTRFSLKKLTLGQCLNVHEIRINAPGLEFFSYKGVPFKTTFFFTSQTVKCEAHMRLSWTENDMAPWLIRLNNFLHRTVRFRALHIEFGAVEVDVVALNNAALTPFELDEMVVAYEDVQPNYRQIFAAVFCCCKPLSLTIELHHQFSAFEERDELFRYIYEQLQHEEDEDWERKVHILARNESHHTQRFANLDDFIDELSALGHDHDVCFKTQRVERVKKKRRIESCSSSTH